MPRSPTAFGLGANESRPVQVRMPNELADQWAAFAKANGVSAAEAYRLAMSELMKGEGALANRLATLAVYAAHLVDRLPKQTGPTPAFRSSKKLDRTPTRRLELQLRESERKAVEVVAKAGNATPAQWVVGLIRAVFVKGVLEPSAELDALQKSTYQLVAIGRNLNQITHQINADPTQLSRLRPERIEALAKTITEHRRKVETLAMRTLERWVLIQEVPRRLS